MNIRVGLVFALRDSNSLLEVRCFMNFRAAAIAHGLSLISAPVKSKQQLAIAYDN